MTSELRAAITYGISDPAPPVLDRLMDDLYNRRIDDVHVQYGDRVEIFARQRRKAPAECPGGRSPEAAVAKADAGGSTAQTSAAPDGANGKPRLIAFAGRAGAGKSTAAQVLSDGYRFTPIALAHPLKRMLFDLMWAQGANVREIESALDGDGKEKPCPYLGGRTPRHAMQTLGTEWGRDLIDPALWINAALRRARQCERAVITDVRFRNEAEAIRAAGGKVLYIVRPDHRSPHVHVSESSIRPTDCDDAIFNHGRSLGVWRLEVERQLLSMGFIA